MPVFGFASVTLHASITVSPSLTMYGLDVSGLTSGLSVKIPQMFSFDNMVKTKYQTKFLHVSNRYKS